MKIISIYALTIEKMNEQIKTLKGEGWTLLTAPTHSPTAKIYTAALQK